ncbi:MAG TPA: outer membrane lipoprotein carrier protein LolA [Gemmatimonadaceae bacterium]|jgi:outer membrane lipoprotein carrier protein
MKRLLTTAVAVSLGAFAQIANAQSVDATIDRAVAAWGKVKTVRGTFEQTVSNPITNGSVKSNGSYMQERPNRLAIRWASPGTDAIIADGRALWIYLPTSAPGQVIKRAAADRDAIPIDPTGQFLDAPKSKYDISAAGTKTIDGHAAHGLLLVAKQGGSAPVSRATVWIDDDDSLIRDFESSDANGVTRHVHLTSLELNTTLDANAFTFAIPKGVKVIDQTKN